MSLEAPAKGQHKDVPKIWAVFQKEWHSTHSLAHSTEMFLPERLQNLWAQGQIITHIPALILKKFNWLIKMEMLLQD